MTTPQTDRRDSPRFEIVGPLWAELELPESATVVNISPAGLLVEAVACPSLNARYATTIHAVEESRTVVTVVRHVRPSGGGRSFLVGLELVDSQGDALVGRVDGEPGHRPASATASGGAMEDRRRHNRRQGGQSLWADLNWPRPVRIVDISARGALLASRQRGSVGARGLLRLTVGSHHFTAAVELCRQSAFFDKSGFHLGVRFLGLVDHQRDLLDTIANGAL